ncbi:MAG: hypothetical protein ACREBJ_02705 [Nitrosotalea sp.]
MISFRVIPSHPDDRGKNRIRVGKDQMRKLGISSGDTVLVTGTKTTAAICLPSDDKRLPHDPEFEFLYDTGTKLPTARLNDVTLYNARENNLLSVVQVEKAKTTEAHQVILSAGEIFFYRKENLGLQDLYGMPFVKCDRIRITNTKYDTRFPFVEFVVVDASPDGDSYVITEKTIVEFSPYKTRTSHVTQLSNLRQEIQLGKKIRDKRITITLESLEIYDEGCRFFLDIKYVFDDPKEWVENRMYAAMSISDDVGNNYRCKDLRQTGSHWSKDSPQYTRLRGIMVPPIKHNASRLALEIKELTWQIRQKKDLQFLDQVNSAIREEPTVVSVWQPHKSIYMIAQGIWRFEIDLG